ncbi:hypothetical protein DPEC_G00265990 [Dallia pectoralis]|uniref:Uncharacterized protein n=1 Tax=Dallia pectoralis TaxID=75939 RepID=A0ACC2FNH2_DALPE|nr:hypothetical protein DPEC_G00265990 [Dallia pectoralis]
MARRAEGCASCIILSQRVDVLEGRVSVLDQIKEDEKLLDSLAALSGVDNDITCPWLGIKLMENHFDISVHQAVAYPGFSGPFE